MTDEIDPVVEVLQPALDQIAERDEALTGGKIRRFYLITEHEWEDGSSTVSSFRSPEVAPWDSLGLLRFMTIVEEDRVVRGGFEEEDDEDPQL
ncbi:MAG: hypothetical protein M3387_01310 [Actinomycetota bacterium]|nr:hypothetical protein [Actinomycetota bacterium]